MTAFIGVRISWLMFARKSDFVRVASSAISFAATSSACDASRYACSMIASSRSSTRFSACTAARAASRSAVSARTTSTSCARSTLIATNM